MQTATTAQQYVKCITVLCTIFLEDSNTRTLQCLVFLRVPWTLANQNKIYGQEAVNNSTIEHYFIHKEFIYTNKNAGKLT